MVKQLRWFYRGRNRNHHTLQPRPIPEAQGGRLENNPPHRIAHTQTQTNEQMDEWTLSSALSPCFTVHN